MKHSLIMIGSGLLLGFAAAQAAPLITLNGGALVTTEAGKPFVDPGATVVNPEAPAFEPVVLKTNGTVKIYTPGDYSLTYTAVNAAGVSNTAVRTVRVVISRELLANYFDIETNAPAGLEVIGKVHLLANYNAHRYPIPESFQFVLLSEPSGLFEIESERDSARRLFGTLKVASGRTAPPVPTDFPLTVGLQDGTNLLSTADCVVHVVAETKLKALLDYSDPVSTKAADTNVAAWIDQLSTNSGRFADITLYDKTLTEYVAARQNVETTWATVIGRLSLLAEAYGHSPVYATNLVQRERLRSALYAGIMALTDWVPMDPAKVLAGGKPIGSDYADTVFRLNEYGVLSYGTVTHLWTHSDPIGNAGRCMMRSLQEDLRKGDPAARAVHERLVDYLQTCFGNPMNYRYINNPDARWGQLTDTNHTEGAYSDANLNHRVTTWLNLPAIWADYNRPITYVPYWYRGYSADLGFPDTLYMPGWTPHGVLEDFAFWIRTFHRPAHLFLQSGFQPDGSVSHHVDFATDSQLNIYGHPWLVDAIDGYNLLKKVGIDPGSHGFQFIADRYLYTYQRLIYKKDFDFSLTGKLYNGDQSSLVTSIPNYITKLITAKQASTVITNEAELLDLSKRIATPTNYISGNFPFWVANHLVHRRGDANGEKPYFFAVRMENDRTQGPEDNASPRLAWHAGSGLLQPRVRGDEHGVKTRNNWDWHALPGLTEEWRTDAIPAIDGVDETGGSAYSGMVSDGRYGCAAMEYRSRGTYSAACANKAWFFTETEAVALGSAVSRRIAGQGREIVTTLDQCLWVSNITYAVNGEAAQTIPVGTHPNLTLPMTGPSWIHQGSIGYVIFPQGAQSLYIVGGSNIHHTSTGALTTNLALFAMGHGIDPVAAGLTNYHYVVVPNKTAAEMPAYLTELTNRVEIVANQRSVQGIYDRSLQLLQLAFYTNTSVTASNGLRVAVDGPAMVQLRPTDGGAWSLSVVDPRHDLNLTALNLEINQSLRSGTYAYELPGIYPRPGETIQIVQTQGVARIRVELPDPADDARYNYQAPLYAGAPISRTIPRDYYADWSRSAGITGGPLDDDDHDGLSNLQEYALGNNPLAAEPRARLSISGSDGVFRFNRRLDRQARGLRYVVRVTSSLINPAWETNGVFELAVDPASNGFECVTQQIGGLTNRQGFIAFDVDMDQ
ncbi:MAG TPA: polysaccharide lyase family 8 super-sandwich domain-containing protein [Pontiellaceae bacterium]|nr:polysaccharide lyase family 8 super-sandwich domain-containing protein [Pontiellaceae bacterium]